MPKIVDHEERKRLIADATIRAIKHVGLEKTTVRKIADEAGLSVGTVQYYFPAQQDLYIYAMELITHRIEDRIRKAVRERLPIEQRAVNIMKQLISYEGENERMEGEAWLEFTVMALRDPALEALSTKLFQVTRELLASMLDALRKSGYLGACLDEELEAISIHSFIDGITLQANVYPKAFDDTKVEKLLTNYLDNLKRRSGT
ncbi:TetR/AcrR family transcriptional regulator [Paenibacillus arenilitoris]|uniref:TetR family transcriptional regulator C-terminal domain-containing protein n=1 Tax=Paenibacillus arenilitoris TaxID=2772299 RepID=A0A927H406_9BACL|nr:TetR/AcrR family transcriptional regulator [Paenibacillus arenilitoris]MBD2867410.1 TetR family transcriptional regulator C-terminal domain-containing protein [Paenibacillus arenilitoris]